MLLLADYYRLVQHKKERDSERERQKKLKRQEALLSPAVRDALVNNLPR